MLPTNRSCGLGGSIVGERIGDLALIEKAVTSKLAAITFPSNRLRLWSAARNTCALYSQMETRCLWHKDALAGGGQLSC
jgi:hypothetical protein